MSHILYVGEDPALRSLHMRIVAEMGHEGDAAEDGIEGLELLTENHYDLIIAHERIQPYDGFSWLRRARSQIAADVPCVLEGNSALAPEAARAGVGQILSLPVDAAEIRSAITRGLLHRQTRRPTDVFRGRFELLRDEAVGAAWGARLQTADVLLERMEANGLGAAATRGRRLAGSVAAVARVLGLARDEIEDIQIGAMLHDVGLLLHPEANGMPLAPMTTAVWDPQRTHPIDGADLLRAIPLLAGAASLVENHHERHDGLGFPAGRAGAEIPTGARIFAVVEAFDDLLLGHDGARGAGVEESLEAVEAGAYNRFDPHVTAALAPAIPEVLRARLRRRRGA